jgi:hypothetical protein
MTRKKKALVLIASIFLVSLLLYVIWERSRGAQQLREVSSRLASAGVEMEPEKFFTHTVNDKDNVAIPLLAISEDLKSFTLPSDVPPPPAMQMVAPGSAISHVKEDGWGGANGTDHRWDRLNEVRAEALRWFTNLQEIAARPRFASPLDISKGTADMELKVLAGLPGASRALRTSALLDLHHGNDARSARAVITLLDLFCNKSEDAFLISEMVRWFHARTGFGLTWELQQHATLPDETWAQLQSAWERCQFLPGYEKVRRAELVSAIDYFTRLKATGSYRRHILDNFGKMEEMMPGSWTPPTRGFVLYRIHAPLWRLLWADQDYASALRAHETEFRLAQVAQSNGWDKVQAEASRLGRTNEISSYAAFGEYTEEQKTFYDKLRYLFSTPPSVFEGSQILRAFEAETEARLAATAIALHRYRLKTGDFPESLAGLVPSFIEEVPIDPMDLNPLRYRRKSKESFLLYSVGQDAMDDEATEENVDRVSKTRTIWHGKDAIWPQRVVR